MTSLSERDWPIRLHIFQMLIENGRPPSVNETAAAFGLPLDEVRAAYQRLHDADAIVLHPGTSEVRMANPLSAVPTPFAVMVGNRTLYATCAWDSLGVPALLGADATITTTYTSPDGSQQPARYAIRNGHLSGDDGIIHIPMPFRHWYDNRVHT